MKPTTRIDSCTSTTWRDVGEDVHEHAPRVRRADRVGRLHVFARLVLQVLGADQPEHAGPAGEAEDQDDRQHALLLQHRGDREDQQQVRNRAEDAVEPVEHVVDPAAVVAGERAEHACRCNVATSAAARPTKIDVSEPLIVFFEDVAAPLVAAERQRRRARFGATARRRRSCSFWMSAITSASGSTDLPSAGAASRRRGLLLALELRDARRRADRRPST